MIRLENYSASFRQSAQRAVRPRTLDDLVELVKNHEPARDGQLTLRMGGHSLHNQALGKGVVVFLDRLSHRIRVVVNDAIRDLESGETLFWSTAEVTGWTPWEAIARATLGLPAPAAWLGSESTDRWTVDRYEPDDAEAPAADDTASRKEGPLQNPQANECWWCVGPGAERSSPLPVLIPYVLVSSGRITPRGQFIGRWGMAFFQRFGPRAR